MIRSIFFQFSTVCILVIIFRVEFSASALEKEKCGVSKIFSHDAGKSPTLFEDFPIEVRRTLGQLTRPYVPDRKNRVVGGIEAEPHSWPWMAALIRGNYYICGAVLIDPLYILTAAHCVVERPFAASYRVILGAHNLQKGEVYRVTRVMPHPQFNVGLPPRGNDVAILKLSQPANVSSPHIGVICMPSFYLASAGGRECVVTGWGRLYEGGPPSMTLQQVKVPILDNPTCGDIHHYPGLIDSTMLCAGWEEGGKDTCQGDSGGPLVCDVNGQWQLHGIVSWGYGCARPSKPGVYARVTTLKNWVQSQMTKLRNDNSTI